MPLKLKDARKSSGAIPPAGNHPARCYSVIDLGTHTEDGNFGVQTNRKLRFSWELPDELHVFDQAKGPQPFAVHRVVNFAMHPKSTLQQMLESWRGKAFEPDELEDFEIQKVVGQPCMVTVVHAARTNNVYANVETVAPLPKKWKAIMAEPVNAPIYYEVGMGRNAVFKSLPDWIQAQISKCQEWGGAKEAKPDVGEAPSQEEDPFKGSGHASEKADDDEEDQIPF
jgi:hypothetical protein